MGFAYYYGICLLLWDLPIIMGFWDFTIIMGFHYYYGISLLLWDFTIIMGFATPKPQHQMQSTLFLYVIVS